KHMRDMQTLILEKMNDFAAAHPTGDYTEADWNEYQKDISILYTLLDPDEQMQTQEYIRKQITAPSRRDSALSRYVENMKNDTYNDLGFIQQTLMGSKLIRTGINTEEQE